MRQIMPMQSIGVLAESELSPSARLVAVMLMYHVNRKNGLCYPSISTLASDCGCQPTTVKKALAELKALGFISWETKQLPKMSTRVNHYNMLFAHWSESDQCNDQTNDWSFDRSFDQSPDRSPDRSISGHNPIEPIEPIEPKKSPHTPQGGRRAASEEYSDDFELFWHEYPNHNSGKKKAYTAFKRALKKVSLAEILKSLDEHKKSSQWTKDGGEYIPHATTWLNGERWTVKMNVLDDGREIDEDGIVWTGRKYICKN